MAARDIVEMSRQQLYDLVWSMTMRDAAKTIPMSNVGLKKVCLRYEVPVPPQGYWNKVRAGHRVEQTPLPPPTSERLNRVVMLEDGFAVAAQNRLEEAARTAAKTPEEAAERERQRRAAKDAKIAERRAAQRASSAKRARPVVRRPKAEVRYVVPIDRWEWGYSFGVNDTEILLQYAYRDHRHLIVHGRVQGPTSIVGSQARLSFVPSAIPVESHHYRQQPEMVGSLWKDRETKQYQSVLVMPEGVLPTLIATLLAKRLRYVVLVGPPLFRGMAVIRRYSFEAVVDSNGSRPKD